MKGCIQASPALQVGLTRLVAMLNSLFPLIYGTIFVLLLWQAFRVMGQGFKAVRPDKDRTGKVTVHPELLDQDGRLTEEDLLTVRFSGEQESSENLD